MACLSSGGILWYANHQLGQLQRVTIQHYEPVVAAPVPQTTVPGQTTTTTEAPLPIVDIAPQNFLLVGSDSRGCISPDSPYYGGLYDGKDTGENSDTIMVIRADPSSNQAAILSFPRDLWVKLADSNGRGKINSVFQNGNASRLVRTIELNFQIRIDHYINVDFCAFKDIVDAVGGVSVPFTSPARDLHTGFELLTPECHTFAGDEALAYTRSRYYEYQDAKGRWISDETSDYGRIARQQDFVKRAVAKAIDKGITRPSVAQKLINAVISRVKVDSTLSINDMLNLAGKLRGFDPSRVRTYRIQGSDDQNNIYADITAGTNRDILRVFRGQARLADGPDPAAVATSSPSGPSSQSPTTTTSTTSRSTTTTTSAPGSGPSSASGGEVTTTTPVIDVKETIEGVAPTKDLTCH